MPERLKTTQQRLPSKRETEALSAPADLESQAPLGNQAFQAALAGGAGNALQAANHARGNQAIQRLASGGAAAEPDLGKRIRQAAGKGQSLDGSVQRSLQEAMGADLSGVRVHTDGEADQMSRSVGALAFTTGNDIFFSQGAYDPASAEGMRTLAHEATHVVQQAAGPVAGTQTEQGVAVSDPSDSFERAAEANAERVVSTAGPAGGGSAVQRAGTEEEEPLQGRFVQRAEEEEALQGRFVQRAGPEEELPAQGRFVQRVEEEEALQGRFVQRAGAPINDDAGLEQEADVMGDRALQGRFVQRLEDEEPSAGSKRQAADGASPSAKRAKVS